PPEIHTLSLHDALPICIRQHGARRMSPWSGDSRRAAESLRSFPALAFVVRSVRSWLPPPPHRTTGDMAVLQPVLGASPTLFAGRDRKSTRLNSSHLVIS